MRKFFCWFGWHDWYAVNRLKTYWRCRTCFRSWIHPDHYKGSSGPENKK